MSSSSVVDEKIFPLLAMCLGGLEDLISKDIHAQCPHGTIVSCEALVPSQRTENACPESCKSYHSSDGIRSKLSIYKGGAGCGKILVSCPDMQHDWQWVYRVRSVQHWLLFLCSCEKIEKVLTATLGSIHGVIEKLDFNKALTQWLERLSSASKEKFAHLRDERSGKKPSFCVRCIRDGEHNFNSVELAVKVGEYIIKRTGWTVDLKTMDLEIVLLVLNERMVMGINLPTDSPPFLKSRIPGEVRPPVVHSSLSTSGLRASTAYVMGLLAHPQPGDVLADCMCGGGAGAIECAFSHNCISLGGDIDCGLIEGWKRSLDLLQIMSKGKAFAEVLLTLPTPMCPNFNSDLI